MQSLSKNFVVTPDWPAISGQVFDVAIIGAGINGAGIALDAALRGLKVLILDQEDYGSGTTSASTRLIHGGLRYLEYLEFSLVRESLQERRILLQTAGDMVQPLPLAIPIYKTSRRGYLTVKLGMVLYDLFSRGKKLPKHRMIRSRAFATMEPSIRSEELTGGALYYDSQINYPERLCCTIVKKARQAGAIAINYCKAKGLKKDDFPYAIDVEDKRDGSIHEIQARIVVNASGPWVDEVRHSGCPGAKKLMGGTKGSHLVIEKKPGGPQNAIYVEAHQDGRPFFIIPWVGHYLVGTTDIHYDGDLNDVVINQDEVDYLLKEVNHYLDGFEVGYEDILYTYSGIRPLAAADQSKPGAISRDHWIKIEKNRPGKGAYLDIIGGKLTTYRNLAEETVDKVQQILAIESGPTKTREFVLIEKSTVVQKNAELRAMQSELSLTDASIKRLCLFYGADVANILQWVRERPELGEQICPGQPAIMAQAVDAVLNEQALCLEDILLRRTGIGWSASMGLDCCDKVARCVGPILGWDKKKQNEEIAKYQNMIAKRHMPDFLPASRKWRKSLS